MTRLAYPIDIEPDGPGWLIRFPDLPEALTGTETRDVKQAHDEARDCLEEALAGRVARREPIPPPSSARRRRLVYPGAVMAAKTSLYSAMRETATRNTDLAAAMQIGENEVRRMLDPRHPTKINRLERALAYFGKRLVVAADLRRGRVR